MSRKGQVVALVEFEKRLKLVSFTKGDQAVHEIKDFGPMR